MRLRVRNHVNPLSSGFDTFVGIPPVLPSDNTPLEVEIGCADAKFLFDRASNNPSGCYIGLEIREDLVDWVNHRAKELALPVQGVFCNANNHLTQLFPQESIRHVFLNFPDPWFKKKHHKRRMITHELAMDIYQCLKPQGYVWIQTDIWDVAMDAMDAFETLNIKRDSSYQMINQAGAWSFWKDADPYQAQSLRYVKCMRDGHDVWRIYYQKQTVT